MLHSRLTVFPKFTGDCDNLSGKEFTATLPDDFIKVLMTLLKKNRLKNNYTLRLVFDYRKEDLEQLWEHGRQEDLEVQH
jgi:hypothetical protein